MNPAGILFIAAALLFAFMGGGEFCYWAHLDARVRFGDTDKKPQWHLFLALVWLSFALLCAGVTAYFLAR